MSDQQCVAILFILSAGVGIIAYYLECIVLELKKIGAEK